jgi:hypothetical protein
MKEKYILSQAQKDIINKKYPNYARLVIRMIEKHQEAEKGSSLDDMIDEAFLLIEEQSFHPTYEDTVLDTDFADETEEE